MTRAEIGNARQRTAEVATMYDSTRLPMLTPEALRGAPAPSEPVRFSLRDTPERQRNDLYRDFFGRSVMRYEVEPSRNIPFDIDVKLQMLPGLLMVTGKMHGSDNRRTRECLADGLDDLAMAVNMGGSYVVRQGEDEIVLGNGEATLFSLGRPCRLVHQPPGHFLALRFPRSQITPRVAGADERCRRRIGAGTPALRLLTDYVGLAQQNHAISGAELRPLFIDHVYDLIALSVGATREVAEAAQGGGLRAARLNAIKQDIAGNLGEPDLSVASLAKRHGCTPRLVQRLFESDGTTFTEYVLAQRLTRAHRMLLDPRRASDKVSVVAYDCGFGDVSYFNRMFRRHFGAAPSDIRAQARAQPPKTLM
jgi:AraC-like DNA-binding protein